MNAGEQIKALREERGMRPADIERRTLHLANELGNPDYAVPHATLNGIESGSVPTIYKLASLASVMDLQLEQLLAVYGINLAMQVSHEREGSRENGAQIEFRRQQPETLAMKEVAGMFAETQIAQQDSPLWDVLPAGLRERINGSARFCYAVIGAREDILGEVLPAGSFVEIDRDQNKIARFSWASIAERPIYCIWHGDGHVCCWCEQTGSTLTIVPHPLSRQTSRRLRLRRDVNVIGRVTNFWRLLTLDG